MAPMNESGIMWRCIILLFSLCILASVLLPVAKLEVAGGMVYDTGEGPEDSAGGIMGYLSGHDNVTSLKQLEKEKSYYMASADKTASRIELAKARIQEAWISDDDHKMLDDRLNAGLAWTKDLKERMGRASNRSEFDKAVDYKVWHAVKMLPTAAEGYAITAAIRNHIEWIRGNMSGIDRGLLDEAESHNSHARSAFLQLLYLDDRADFHAAEKARTEAFNDAREAHGLMKKAYASGHRL